MSNVAEEPAEVVALWRYPVKSMMGEELNAAEVTQQGVLGDRPYALVDADTGKVVSAKEPRKWAKLFEFQGFIRRAARVSRKAAARANHLSGRTLDDDCRARPRRGVLGCCRSASCLCHCRPG